MSRGAAVGWRGYWPAAPTPFRATGELDLESLSEVIRLYVSHGVHGILANGTTGEWWSQTFEERVSVAGCAVEAAAGRVPVVVGVTDFTASRCLELAEAAASAGADGVLATVPPYVHPTDAEAVHWYGTLSSGSPLPVMVYNWPRGVGVDLSSEVMVEIATMDNVAAIKDSSGDELKTLVTLERLEGVIPFFARFISRRGLAVLRELGGAGNIDGGGIGALLGSAFYESVWRGDLEAARDYAARYQMIATGLTRADYSGRFGSPVAQVKAAMRILGQPGGHVRPPLMDVADDVASAHIMGPLERSGLLRLIDERRAAGTDDPGSAEIG